MEQLTTVAERLGIPVAMVVGLSFAMFVAARWLGKNILKPLIDAHIDFIGELKQEIKNQSESLRETAQTQKELLRYIRDNGSRAA